MSRRQFMIAILSALVLLTLAFAPTSSQQAVREYDPWCDINDDGKIDIKDIALIAIKFGATGTSVNKTALLLELKAKVDAISLDINVLIDYGNGTKEWHNQTTVPFGTTVFTAALAVAQVKYRVYNGGIYVISINGLSENTAEGTAWFWYYWNTTASQWVIGEIGSNYYVLSNDESIRWAYESYGI